MEPDDSSVLRWVGVQLGIRGRDRCEQALSSFLAIRDVEYRGDILLKNLLSSKRVQLLAFQDAVLRFLSLLPHSEWTVVGCKFLLDSGGRWNAVAVASLLRKVMAQARGRTLMAAEICWIRNVVPAVRALASNAPVAILSAIDNNMLFAAEDYFLFDETRRCVFCWADEWEADQNKEIWRFVPSTPSCTEFFILSVFSQEYLYASDIAAADGTAGFGEKCAFTWRSGDPPGESGLWRLVPVDGTFAIYNPTQDTYLVSPKASGSAFRRAVVTSSYRPLDQEWNQCHKWNISPASPSLMERALDAFFAKDFAKAVELFTTLLETEKPPLTACVKVYWYRMVAHLRLHHKDQFRADADKVGQMGGCPKYFLEETAAELGDSLTPSENGDLAHFLHFN
ncbi:hypothetical protein PHYBOEH_007042 [Phytophthora boehmeriae]|uniref:Uncharacterized protein n=1 Tax=Phytophthora boehmeriae TaxID=109152 RepID=A0A8T1WAQ6_9STRA|nr:hypothetical protein PHYBOEH_007042 [Phytophthora boehmeriae]